MATTKMLAGLIGPTFVAVAVSMLLNLNSLAALIEQGSANAALILTTGVITFVVGLAIVRAHNHWSGGWPVVVTVLGWLFLLGGLVRMLFPTQLASAAIGLAHDTWYLAAEAVILLAVGGFLSFRAYSQD
jgi:hypothetical protein